MTRLQLIALAVLASSAALAWADREIAWPAADKLPKNVVLHAAGKLDKQAVVEVKGPAEKAVQVDPNNVTAWTTRANYFYVINKPDLAMKAANRAVAKNRVIAINNRAARAKSEVAANSAAASNHLPFTGDPSLSVGHGIYCRRSYPL